MIVNALHVGEGAFCIEGILVITERGTSITVCTQEHSHIGACALAQPRPSLDDVNRISATVSSLAVLSHEDDIPARRMAKKIATASNLPCVVTCGLHIDDATDEDIEQLLQNVNQICEQILAQLA